MNIITLMKVAALAAAAGFATGASAQDASKPMKIGVMSDQSSLYAAIGGPGAMVATQLAVEKFGGKLLGQPIEVISADHQNKPDIASSIARRWMENENVVALTDNATSSAALAVQALVREQKKMVVLSSGAGAVALVDDECSPVGALWAWNTRTTARVAAQASIAEGSKKWFFITADYAFGHLLEGEAMTVVKASGGEVVGSVRHPLNTADFSSYILQASSSGADIIALANGGGDTINALKQIREFGVTEGGQKVTALMTFATDIKSIGLDLAKGLLVTSSFVWNRTPESTAFSEEFFKRHGAMPTDVQAGAYSSTLHFLEAAEAAGTVEPEKVIAKMRELPVDDGVFATNGKLREDGLMLHDVYLSRINSPDEAESEWDMYDVVRVVPAEEAYWPLSESRCPLVQK